MTVVFERDLQADQALHLRDVGAAADEGEVRGDRAAADQVAAVDWGRRPTASDAAHAPAHRLPALVAAPAGPRACAATPRAAQTAAAPAAASTVNAADRDSASTSTSACDAIRPALQSTATISAASRGSTARSSSADDRKLAEQIAAQLPGVARVDNRIQLSSKLSDRFDAAWNAVTDKLLRLLAATPLLLVAIAIVLLAAWLGRVVSNRMQWLRRFRSPNPVHGRPRPRHRQQPDPAGRHPAGARPARRDRRWSARCSVRPAWSAWCSASPSRTSPRTTSPASCSACAARSRRATTCRSRTAKARWSR